MAEITMLLSWYVFGVLEPPKLQSIVSLAFWILTPKSHNHWDFEIGPAFCLALCCRGKEPGAVCGLPPCPTDKAIQILATPPSHKHQVAFMKHKHILSLASSLAEGREMWSPLPSACCLETGTTSNAHLCWGILYEKNQTVTFND